LHLGRARTYAGLMSGMPGGDVILQHSETNRCGKAKTRLSCFDRTSEDEIQHGAGRGAVEAWSPRA